MKTKALYDIREKLCRFYMKNELILKTILKFICYLFIIRQIANWDGFAASGILNAFSVHMLLAVICTLLPARCVGLVASLAIIYSVYLSSLWGAVLVAVVLLIIYVMVARLCPDEAFILVLMPIAMKWQFFLAVPMFCGMYLGLFSLIPMACGVVLWGILRVVPTIAQMNVEAIDQLPNAFSDTFDAIIDQLTRTDGIVFLIIVAVVVLLIVYFLNKLEAKNIRYLSLVAASAVGLVFLLVGRIFGATDMNFLSVLVTPVFSLVILLVIEFFSMSLNYRATQRMTFADDDYYYYVKAVPKAFAPAEAGEIKTIAPTAEDLALAATAKPIDTPSVRMTKADNEVAALERKLEKAVEKAEKKIVDATVKKKKPEEPKKPVEPKKPEEPKKPVEPKPADEDARIAELRDRTGWSEDTITGFLSGLNDDEI